VQSINTGRAHRSAPASHVADAASPVSAPGPILHVHAAGAVGGAGRVVQLLAIAQHEAGNDVTVAVVLDQGDDGSRFCDPIEAAGVRTRRWQVPSRRYDQEHALVTGLCRELAPGVVHTHGYRADVVAARAARRLGIPVVSTAHGFTGGDWKNRLFQRLQCGSFRRAEAVIAVSTRLADDLAGRGVPGDRIHVVPNAYPDDEPRLPRAAARERLGVPVDRLHLGWVGRISPEKGLDVLLDALSHLEDLPITVSVIGDGPDRPALRDRGVSAGAADRVLWHGSLPDAGALFPAFDLFVLSSRSEGTPIVLFEAMAAEVPIVATTVGGVPDVVSEAEAVLTPPEDPARLASAIRRALADRDAAATRARAARRRLTEAFGVGPWVERHADVYRQARAARP
jgi:glycosyltransferase involved in cell wall biosynthesis